tara:strand:+ start:953 stop:2089 length:1137 start_codon:yes stop_codon:yes gene_type:complete
MATDVTLVKGAYDANAYRGAGVDAAQKAIGDDLNEAVGKLAAKKRKEKEAEAKKDAANEANAKTVSANPGATTEDVAAVREEVLDWHDTFGDKSPQEQQDMINDISNTGEEMQNYVSFRSSISENILDRNVEGGKSGSGLSAGTNSLDNDWANSMVDPSQSMQVKKTKGANGKTKTEFGVIGPDGEWMNIDAAQDHLNSLLVDVNAMNELTTIRDNNMSTNNVSKGKNFPTTKVNEQVDTIIKNTTNKNSIYTDNMFGDSSFVEDLKKGNLQLRYSDMGFSQEVIDKMDTDDDGLMTDADIFSDGDQGSVIDAYMKDKQFDTQRELLLKDYLTEHIKRNWRSTYKEEYGNDAYMELFKAEALANQKVIDEKRTVDQFI